MLHSSLNLSFLLKQFESFNSFSPSEFLATFYCACISIGMRWSSIERSIILCGAKKGPNAKRKLPQLKQSKMARAPVISALRIAVCQVSGFFSPLSFPVFPRKKRAQIIRLWVFLFCLFFCCCFLFIPFSAILWKYVRHRTHYPRCYSLRKQNINTLMEGKG